MVSCLCPYRDYRHYPAPASAVAASALAVGVRVLVVAAVEHEVLAQVVLAPQHVRLALAAAYARSASADHVVAVVAVAGVLACAAPAQRVELRVAPDHGLSVVRQAGAVAAVVVVCL